MSGAPAEGSTQESSLDSFDAVVRAQPLSVSVKHHRRRAAGLRLREEAALQPRIAAHLAISSEVLDWLAQCHQEIADTTDLEIDADTRQAAIWTMSGRCIGLGRAVVVLLQSGFGAESATQARALHEANRLLGALMDEQETDILRRWLSDDDKHWVRPRECREVMDRQRVRTSAALQASKSNAEAAGDDAAAAHIQQMIDSGTLEQADALGEASRKVYDTLSRIGHNRRSGTHDAVAVLLRTMATGPHPSPTMRATYVDVLGRVIEETAIYVGSALSRFYGPGFFMERVGPLRDRLHAVREESPLASPNQEQV